MLWNAKTILRVFGIDMRVGPSWILIGALIVWSLSHHVFPVAQPNLTQATYTVMSLGALVLILVSLILHELAHAFVARRSGTATRSITLYPFGGVADFVGRRRDAWNEGVTALAGPVMSLFLSGTFWALSAAAAQTMPVSVVEVLKALAIINLAIAAFNLLPGYPLDGGRVLRAVISHRGGDTLDATKITTRVAFVIAYGFIGFGALSLFEGGIAGAIWLIVLGLCLLLSAERSIEAQRVATLLGTKSVAKLMTQHPITTAPHTTLAELVNQVMLPNRISFVPVTDGELLLGHIDTSVLVGMDRENWANTQVGDVFVTLNDSASINAKLPVTDLFARIAATGQRKFMVLQDRRLVGVITLADLTRYLALLKDIGAIARHTSLSPVD